MLFGLFQTTDDRKLTILRLVLGVVMLAHGSQKMLGVFGGFGFSGTMRMFEGMGIPAVFAFLAICAEFLGGLGLIVGFLGRIAAFGVITNMVVAIAMIHIHVGFFMNWTGQQAGEGFEYHLLAITIGLVILIGGSGAFSLDRALSQLPGLRETGSGA